MPDDDRQYCSTYETVTCCRFFALGQQQSCCGFARATWAHRCMWWERMGDSRYRCSNPDSQAWAAAEFNKKLK